MDIGYETVSFHNPLGGVRNGPNNRLAAISSARQTLIINLSSGETCDGAHNLLGGNGPISGTPKANPVLRPFKT